MSAKSEDVLDIPPGVPDYITITEFAAATNIKARTIRVRVDKGSIKTMPKRRNQKRLIPIRELARYERDGYPIDWEILI